jgi:hypothetical protein
MNPWIPWTFALVLILFVTMLMGQAAYIRSRLDGLAPKTSPDSTTNLSIQAVRAYSVRVDVASTKTLSRYLVNLKIDNISDTCGRVNKHGKLPAKWLVLKNTDGNGQLASDVQMGLVRNIVLYTDTYAIVNATGSDAERDARETLGSNSDVTLYLVASMSTFSSSIQIEFDIDATSQEKACTSLPIRAPITNTSGNNGDIFKTVETATERYILTHVWGYSGSNAERYISI